MNSKEMKEQISALVDSELPENALGAVLVGLRNGDEHAAWDMYHQIGDVLRSDEMAISLSSDFSAKMQARLDAEPVYIAPAVANNFATAANDAGQSRKIKRFAVPGMAAAAAIAALAFVVMPQAPSTAPGLAAASTASAPVVAAAPAAVAAPAAAAAGSSIMLATSKPGAQNLGLPGLTTLAQQGEVVRDPRIDDYLLAHQRFSPSDSNSAQYTRPAAYAVDTEK